MFDNSLMFRTAGEGDLTAAESGGPVTIYGTPIKGMSVKVVVPGANGADGTFDAKLYASTDGTNYNVIARSQEGPSHKPGTDGHTYIIPFSLPKGQKTYLKLELEGTDTTTNFGAVVAGLVLGRGAEVDRDVDWNL